MKINVIIGPASSNPVTIKTRFSNPPKVGDVVKLPRVKGKFEIREVQKKIISVMPIPKK